MACWRDYYHRSGSSLIIPFPKTILFVSCVVWIRFIPMSGLRFSCLVLFKTFSIELQNLPFAWIKHLFSKLFLRYFPNNIPYACINLMMSQNHWTLNLLGPAVLFLLLSISHYWRDIRLLILIDHSKWMKKQVLRVGPVWVLSNLEMSRCKLAFSLCLVNGLWWDYVSPSRAPAPAAGHVSHGPGVSRRRERELMFNYCD